MNTTVNDLVKIFITILILTSPVYAIPYIEDMVIQKTNNSNWVNVIIVFNDISQINHVLSNLSSDEFNYEATSYNSVLGDLSPAGLEKLSTDERISGVYYNIPVHGTNISQDNNYTNINDNSNYTNESNIEKNNSLNSYEVDKKISINNVIWIIVAGIFMLIFIIVIRKKIRK